MRICFFSLFLLISIKKIFICFVDLESRCIFASAFRKERRENTIFDTISYRQVVRRACSLLGMSEGKTNRQEKIFRQGNETDLSKKRQTGTSV